MTDAVNTVENKKKLSLREIQLGEFEILKEFKSICEKAGCNYFLYYGTLLGAVRHSGFIPWDDDVDVAMARDDYEKLLAYCKSHSEEMKPLELLHYSTNPDYIYPIARLNDTRYKTVYKDVDDYGLGLFVDIYPFDGCGNSDEEAERIGRDFFDLEHLIALAGTNHFEKSLKGGFINSVKKLAGYLLSHTVGANRLCKRIDNKAKHYPFESKFIGCIAWRATDALCYPRKSWSEREKLFFEGELFDAPTAYDEVLKIGYGDYMKLPPENERIAHHYYDVYLKRETEL